MLLSTIALVAFGGSTALATPLLGSLWGSKVEVSAKEEVSAHLDGRDVTDGSLTQLPTCRRDDLYELFTNPEVDLAASAFCSIYIASSSLVRAIITPTKTVTLNVTATGAIATTTHAANSTASQSYSYSNATLVQATGTSLNATSLIVPPLLKRQDSPGPPEAGAYPSLRLSSACSCLVTPSTIVTTLTTTAAAVYTTVTQSLQVTSGDPGSRNTSALTTLSLPQPLNGTAGVTATVAPTLNSTTVPPAIPIATISVFPNSTANATGTIPQDGNGTMTGVSVGTSSASARAAYCNQTYVRGNGTFLARYTVRCNYSYSNLNPIRVVSRPSYYACARECDNDSRCYGYSFLLSGDAENCYIYNYYPLPPGIATDLFDSGSYVIGSNNGMKH